MSKPAESPKLSVASEMSQVQSLAQSLAETIALSHEQFRENSAAQNQVLMQMLEKTKRANPSEFKVDMSGLKLQNEPRSRPPLVQVIKFLLQVADSASMHSPQIQATIKVAVRERENGEGGYMSAVDLKAFCNELAVDGDFESKDIALAQAIKKGVDTYTKETFVDKAPSEVSSSGIALVEYLLDVAMNLNERQKDALKSDYYKVTIPDTQPKLLDAVQVHYDKYLSLIHI